MASILLADVPAGKYRLNLMKKRIEAFMREHPAAILDADEFFEAVNVPIASPAVQAEVSAQIEAAADLLTASLAEATSALTPPPSGSKRAAAHIDLAGSGSPAAAAGRALAARPLQGAALQSLFGDGGVARDLEEAARPLPPVPPAVPLQGTFTPTFSFDDGSALGTVRSLAAAKLGDDIRNAFDDQSSPAAQVFSPMLAELNDSMRVFSKAVSALLRLEFSATPADPLVMPSAELRALTEPAAISKEQALAIAEAVRQGFVDQRDRMQMLCRLWWLSVHTRGCSFETAKQILFRQQHDLHAARVDPSVVPLTEWPVMVREAMAALGQASAVSKDGNPLGPVAPGLQTFVKRNLTPTYRLTHSGEGSGGGGRGRGSGRQQYAERSDRQSGGNGGNWKRPRRTSSRGGRGGGAASSGGQRGNRKKAAAKDAGAEAPDAADPDV